MQDLPDDLLGHVLSFLDARDVARAGCACRSLRAASETVPVDVAPRRRCDDVAKFAERRAEFVRAFVARSVDCARLWPAFSGLRRLRLCVGTPWSFVDHLPPALRELECLVNDASLGVLRLSALARLPCLRVARIRVSAHAEVLVVLDVDTELDELAVLRAPTILVSEPPRANHLRLDAQLLLPCRRRLRDCERLRISCPLATAATLAEAMPRAVRDLSLRTGTYAIPTALPSGVRRAAFWGSSVVVDTAALRRAAADQLAHVEIHARYTIGTTAPLSLLPPHVTVVATLGGVPTPMW